MCICFRIYLHSLMKVWIWDVVVWSIAAIVWNMYMVVAAQFSHIVNMIVRAIIRRYVLSWFVRTPFRLVWWMSNMQIHLTMKWNEKRGTRKKALAMTMKWCQLAKQVSWIIYWSIWRTTTCIKYTVFMCLNVIQCASKWILMGLLDLHIHCHVWAKLKIGIYHAVQTLAVADWFQFSNVGHKSITMFFQFQ